MSYQNYRKISTYEINGYTFDDWYKILVNANKMILLEVPCPSWGSCNSHLDIADDYYGALILGESIAEYCEEISYHIGNSSIQFLLQVRDVTILAEKLAWYSQLTEDEYSEFYSDFNLEERTKIYFPDIADSFLANYIGGEYDLDDEEVEESHRKYPERRHQFWKSFASLDIGYEFYVSRYSWIVPLEGDITELLQKYGGVEDELLLLEEANYLSILNHEPIVFNKTSVVSFPQERLFQTQTCARDILLQKYKDKYFDIQDFNQQMKKIFLAKEGDILIVCDEFYKYVFFRDCLEKVRYDKLEEYLNIFKGLVGKQNEMVYSWQKLNDEQFEELCYHIICKHYKPIKIRKMGKSRSRDGGRDIEFYTPARLGTDSIKWIVQCKLIRDGSSLTASKINMMDTIAQYGAKGFCVMTSSVIDSNLYDRLDDIKRNYGIEIDDWSKLEIENFLDKYQELKHKYFFD
ncbi:MULTISPECIES: hypothetical protein [Nostoc]|uniref:Restriction endonuclease type IV Mrr domain-containing protein n=1 Tax=Nostoc paludosum FACHB-159 TaxID=2692908 RepID=A0ABR8K6Y3_9NOSO|nr:MULTISPECIES: hypothetical protein [Nostoc]MBD2677513.1 hypothetical protein [Nostoc sp. FACHB-857]MBD2734093.1 hypothetical protein [Nostoc paludosum FACHB-159]